MNQQLPKEVTQLFYSVKKVESDEVAPGYTFPSGMSHMIIAPDNDNAVITSCSDIYELIPNKDLILPFWERITQQYNVEAKVRSWDINAFKIDYIFKDFKTKKDRRVGDIFPRFSQINSYDKSFKYQFQGGFYRLACLNGMTVPVKGTQNQKVKLMHTPKAGNKVALEETIKGIEQFLADSSNILSAYDPLLENRLRQAQAEKRLEELVEEEVLAPTLLGASLDRLRLEISQGHEINDFLVYNASNYALNNQPAVTASRIMKIDDADRKVLEYLIAN